MMTALCILGKKQLETPCHLASLLLKEKRREEKRREEKRREEKRREEEKRGKAKQSKAKQSKAWSVSINFSNAVLGNLRARVEGK